MKKINNKLKRKLRNRKKLKSVNVNRFRVSVSKSLNNLSAQIIDDKEKKNISFCFINWKRN
jgi:ribosomal protein L18